ncbi:uncharacterized protein At4g28440-like [Gastrolobium bilobum]|uniref:uncharacterized protein At4g28440-like n=1 Tax=Gastrolobium bilobum TaxID=150636 RepID=UPI002AB167AA|nr:uncharacterized protein At4g28440-like [Gastrolobium bilobum]
MDEYVTVEEGVQEEVEVQQLRPGTSGHTLTVKVVDTKIIWPHCSHMQIAESLVGDETAMIVFTSRDDQVDQMKNGSTLILRNAKIIMYRGSMRLAVDNSGRIKVADPATFTVKEDNNMSLIEYGVIRVAI